MVVVDDSFKRPGSVPFKWEIRPGVPKIHQQLEQEIPPKLQQKKLSPPMLPQPSFNLSRSSSPFTTTPKQVQVPEHRLKPPPPGLVSNHLFEPRTRSFRSERWQSQVNQPTSRVQPECVSPGCFPSSPIVLRRKNSMKNRTLIARVLGTKQAEDEYLSDVDTLSQRSISSRRSLSMSPFGDSPLSFSPSSYRFSARPVSNHDSDWAGFGLF